MNLITELVTVLGIPTSVRLNSFLRKHVYLPTLLNKRVICVPMDGSNLIVGVAKEVISLNGGVALKIDNFISNTDVVGYGQYFPFSNIRLKALADMTREARHALFFPEESAREYTVDESLISYSILQDMLARNGFYS